MVRHIMYKQLVRYVHKAYAKRIQALLRKSVIKTDNEGGIFIPEEETDKLLIQAYSKYKMQSNKTRRKNNREANEIMKIITQSIKEIEYNEAGITVLTKEQQQELTKLSLPLISFLAKNFPPTAKIIITDESTELLDRSVRILNTSFLRD